jgi:hypothetical protein
MVSEIREMHNRARSAGKTLLAEDVVKWAKSKKDYPDLYEHLWGESEDVLLAEARLSRAHRLIISIKTTVEPGRETRVYVHTKSEPGYYSKEQVESDPNLVEIHMQRLRDDIWKVLQKYRACAAFLDERAVGLGRKLEEAWDATFKPGHTPKTEDVEESHPPH